MKVGIISPSSGLMKNYPERVKRGLSWMRGQGWFPILGAHSMEQYEYVSASVNNRVKDINEFLDSDVDMILASIGGYNCNQLLPYLNYDKIRETHKIFCGYSDFTAILLATAIKGLGRCIYGPTFLVELCEYPFPYDCTINCLNRILKGEKFNYNCPDYAIREFVDWADEEHGTCREKKKERISSWTVLQRGYAEGTIWGGNLNTLIGIIGSDYFPLSVLDGAILFLEDLEENPAVLDSMFHSLRIRGVFNLIDGLIIGRFRTDILGEKMRKIIPLAVNRTDIPILVDVDIGHVSPMLSIPLGTKTILDTRKEIVWQTMGFEGKGDGE